MQGKQAGEKIVRRVGVEEELIKFRPSPNFKNMKKFLKSRSDYSETTTLAFPLTTGTPAVESHAPLKKNEKKEVKPLVVLAPHAISAAAKPIVVQPPLPPYPPPESPPLNVTIKQERQDDDDETQNNSSGEGEAATQDTQQTIAEKQPTKPSPMRPKKTICKEFIRGNCTRPVCKYAHEVDVSQLAGVFTFCWNYQNDVCTFPNCRFVHASVFEEAEFYRTGILPPHARSHLKKQQAPPPPPPDESHPEINFTNPPPPPHHLGVEQRPEVDQFRTALPCNRSPLKREWTEIEDFSTSPRELESNEHMAKKCKDCDIMEFSLKCNKEMVEGLIQSTEEVYKKIGLLNKKSHKLFNVLNTILKTACTNKTTVGNGLITGAEKEKFMLEQLNSFVGNNRLSSNDDSLKNMIGGNSNLPSLMAKLLCSAGEQAIATDTSRET